MNETKVELPIPESMRNNRLLDQFMLLWSNDPVGNLVRNSREKEPKEGLMERSKFILVSSINSQNLPCGHAPQAVKNQLTENPMTVHWFNNKSMHFDQAMRTFLTEMITNLNASSVNMSMTPNHSTEDEYVSTQLGLLEQRVKILLHEWLEQPDIVYAIDPADGSCIIWSVYNLDRCQDHPCGFNTQLPTMFSMLTSEQLLASGSKCPKNAAQRKQISLFNGSVSGIQQVQQHMCSRIPDAVPWHDATSCYNDIIHFGIATNHNLSSQRPIVGKIQLEIPKSSDKNESFASVFVSSCPAQLFCKLILFRGYLTGQFEGHSPLDNRNKHVLLENLTLVSNRFLDYSF
ncbi:DmX-like protein 1 [Cichlidogyrus casuarinus]|uniref:DmX-like protein 1 n=1 Tax=Cichlidogyrus casuarinus TaxID=1844966 RepID=A0ABD2Q5V7_9PLAT